MKHVICVLLLSSNLVIHTMEDKASNLTNQPSSALSFSEQDYQTFCTAHAIADRIINLYARYADITNIDRRKASHTKTLHALHTQTAQGLYISADLGFANKLVNIATPWGIWCFSKKLPYYLDKHNISLLQRKLLNKITLQDHSHTKWLTKRESHHRFFYPGEYYLGILTCNGLELPSPILKAPQEFIPDADAHKLWTMMQQRRDFEHATLKSLCLAYIKKHRQQLESQLSRLPDDLILILK